MEDTPTYGEREHQTLPSSLGSDSDCSSYLEASNVLPDLTNVLHGLVVDENRVNLRLLVTLMEGAKYTYKEAQNGQQAVDTFKNSDDQHFDFVLIDIGMPVLNGVEATKLIREHEREQNLILTHIIALTAWTETKTQEEAIAAGMDVFLSKPVKFPTLRKMLDNLSKPAGYTVVKAGEFRILR